MKKALFCLGFLAACSGFLSAQVTIGTNNPPDPSAVLDLQSNSKGFAIARLTTVQRNAIANPILGLQIYNTDTDCLEMFFASGGWQSIQCGCNAFPNATFNVTSGTVNSPVTISSPIPNMTYSWSFQSGSPATSSTQSTQVTWANTGTFGVNLTLTDSAGCSASFADSITIGNCSPFTVNLTNCGQTGRTGPSQNQANATYGPGVVTVNNGIQSWTVPQTGGYLITVAGAGVSGGRGAVISGEFSLVAGQVLKIAVGQKQGAGGGSGGTFVATSANNPLIIGGGGGAPLNSSPSANHDATFTQVANNGNRGNGGGNAPLLAGYGGEWKAQQFTGIYGGGGGGGFYGDGTANNYGCGGQAFVNGANGGQSNCGNGDANGGFGGGGAGYTNIEPGGGGGYSGGGGGGCGSSGCGGGYDQNNRYSGGGGSFNAGANPQNLGYNSTDGYVTITKICP